MVWVDVCTGCKATPAVLAGGDGVYTKPGTYIHSNAWHIQLRGGTLSECAGREQTGGTFHFGNVPGLALTILGISRHVSVFRPLFLLHYHHSWPNKLTNASKARQKEKRCESNAYSRDLKERLQAVKGEGSSSGRSTSPPLVSVSSSGRVKSAPTKG
jgi:hypothetical protein